MRERGARGRTTGALAVAVGAAGAGALALLGPVGAATAAPAAVTAPAPGAAAAAPGAPELVASGLDSPRHLTVTADGALLVAEAGHGGDGPCSVGGDGREVCFGTTGAVTRVADLGAGRQERIVTGLPSLAAADGSSAAGPSDVLPGGENRVVVAVGLGAGPGSRSLYPDPAGQLGTLLQVTLTSDRRAVLTDVAGDQSRAAEVAGDPAVRDSDPVGIARDGAGGYLVADAGSDAVLDAGPRGTLVPLAELPSRRAEAPPFMGLAPGAELTVEAAPTSVVTGPDGARYVSELTGYPYPNGMARIYRVARDGTVTVAADGLTTVTDLAYAEDDTLYAVETSSDGLLTGTRGALVRVHDGGGYDVVADDLDAPYGLTIRDGSAYVTVGSDRAGDGGVVRIPLGDGGSAGTDAGGSGA